MKTAAIPINKTALLTIYRAMVRIRLAEEKLAEKVLEGEIKTPCHLYVGQEAVATGICAALSKHDYVFGNHRSHGHYLAKGGDMKKLFAEIYGKSTGCSGGRGGSMHLIAPEVGFMGAQPLVSGTIPVAVGASLASSITKDKRVVVSFFGDGAVEEGVFHESLNFAALKRLPIIFVCENNLYSSHLHIRERRPQNNIYKHGIVHGIKSFSIDGQNVISLYALAKKIIQLIKTKKGPALIEARTYRFRGHVGAVDATEDQHITDIRDKEEVQSWVKKDPITIFESYVKKHNLIKMNLLTAIKSTAEKEVEQACKFAKESPYPSSRDLLSYVFQQT